MSLDNDFTTKSGVVSLVFGRYSIDSLVFYRYTELDFIYLDIMFIFINLSTDKMIEIIIGFLFKLYEHFFGAFWRLYYKILEHVHTDESGQAMLRTKHMNLNRISLKLKNDLDFQSDVQFVEQFINLKWL